MSRFRLDELAAAGGVTARTVRFYRERGLLPAPMREGRIAWYGQEHLERLRLISHLLDRGHTLSGVAELLDAWEQGSDVAELIGVERAVTEHWLDEEPVILQLHEMVELFGSEASAESLLEAAALGYLDVRGDDVVHVSRRLLDACVALVREGIPLMTVLAAARQMRSHTEAIADIFVGLVRRHVLDELELLPSPTSLTSVADVVARLRPLAADVAQVDFALSMDRRVREEFGDILETLARRQRESTEPGRATS